MVKNQFYWYENGNIVKNYFKFELNNSYVYNKMKGQWKVIGPNTIWFKSNRRKKEYTFQFADEKCLEAVQIMDGEGPRSKIKMN